MCRAAKPPEYWEKSPSHAGSSPGLPGKLMRALAELDEQAVYSVLNTCIARLLRPIAAKHDARRQTRPNKNGGCHTHSNDRVLAGATASITGETPVPHAEL